MMFVRSLLSIALFAGASLACAQSAPGAPTDRAATATGAAPADARAPSTTTASRADDRFTFDHPAPKFHPFSLRPIPPEQESWDPTWQIDPRIARYQRWTAPN